LGERDKRVSRHGNLRKERRISPLKEKGRRGARLLSSAKKREKRGKEGRTVRGKKKRKNS